MEDVKKDDERPVYEEPQLLDLEEVSGGICYTCGSISAEAN